MQQNVYGLVVSGEGVVLEGADVCEVAVASAVVGSEPFAQPFAVGGGDGTAVQPEQVVRGNHQRCVAIEVFEQSRDDMGSVLVPLAQDREVRMPSVRRLLDMGQQRVEEYVGVCGERGRAPR
ncbi:hypothetical protein ACFWPV_12595 [Streptomyces uncialis]|uniref:hypothetical protein n=1 Tax=Streptomyces uncialis TaxID=1048205 RepID=UPI00364D20E0